MYLCVSVTKSIPIQRDVQQTYRMMPANMKVYFIL